MAKTNIGRVSVVPKDEYSSTENYKRLDVVSSDGSMYISKKDNNIGNPLTDKNWWFKAVEKGEKGDKPVNGVDYNTPEEKEEFKNEVVSTATTEVKQNIETIKEEAIQEFNSNASTKTNEYNDNTTTKLSEYNTNANSKVEEYNSNATQKTNTFNENATSKVSEYNTNASTQTETFNTNATNKTNDFNSNASTKTDEFNTNYEEKLESINEASTSIEQERVISDGKYARALKTQVEDIEQIQIYAENPEVEELKIKGAELTQKTREGYNQLKNTDVSRNHNGIDFTVNSDGTVLANGTATGGTSGSSTSQINIHDEEIQFEAGDYTIQDCKAYVVYEDDSYEWFDGLTKATSKTFDKSFKITDVYIQVNPKITVNNKLYYPMITKGEEVKPYEEYGASPSIDFPSEIQIASEQNIQICQSNIIDTTDVSTKLSGLDFISNSDGGININGTPTSTWTVIKTQNLTVPIKSGTNLYFNYGKTNQLKQDNTDFNVFIRLLDKDNSILYTLNSGFNNVIVGQEVYKIAIGIQGLVLDKSYNEDTYIELEISDEQPTQFQKYESTDITIPLVNSAIGQYTDTIDRKNNVQNKVIQELTLTGDENWSLQTSPNRFNVYNVPVNALKNAQLCTHFKTYNEYANAKGTFALGGNYIRVYNDNNMTLEEWKAFLAQQNQAGTPVKFYYVSETIDKIPLSEEIKQELNKFKLYDDLNNVFIDKGSLSFKYNKSLLRAFEEQSELSASLLERIQALEQAQVNSVGGN